jgi:diguanylate cyclase (GGDEF)-like protein
MEVMIPPPFWLTWWFRAAAVVLASGMLLWAYRWRVARLSRRQTLLEHLVQQRTGELARKNEALSHAYAALENLSVTDPLTGLQNRRFVEKKLPDDLNLVLRRFETAENRSPVNASMIFFLIDLDYFKLVNDRHGHAAGDHVLIEVRRRLQQVFRDSDYLVRWGGEEFLAIARDTNAAGASEVARRIHSVVADTDIILEDGNQIRQTCSIGYAAFPFFENQPRLLTWQQVLKLADIGLYSAKHGGRAAWVGLTAGDVEITPDQVEPMLKAPAWALSTGLLKTCGSLNDAELEKAWVSRAAEQK